MNAARKKGTAAESAVVDALTRGQVSTPYDVIRSVVTLEPAHTPDGYLLYLIDSYRPRVRRRCRRCGRRRLVGPMLRLCRGCMRGSDAPPA